MLCEIEMGNRRKKTRFALSSLALLMSASACAPCGLTSTISDFEPDCRDAVARQYDTETRVALPGGDKTLVIYLPGDIELGTRYGGTTGNPVTFLLDNELAIGAGSTVTLQVLDEAHVEGSMRVQFESGDVEGTFSGIVSPAESR